MDSKQKEGRYNRIAEQLRELLRKDGDIISKMSTVTAVLHGKMPHFFWTGFYRLVGDKLIAGPYQGPVACQTLDPAKGVCRACVSRNESIIVPDVSLFPGHIACDSRSKSEIVVPVHDHCGNIVAVLDVDSDRLNSFDECDRGGLEKIVRLLSGV
ncbi:MAG: GAF domain-containing protein [Acidobacteria bacterium]|nr:GAF domain-containing protein [Acidobacteriota bacterium]